jgi:hypothetical protein
MRSDAKRLVAVLLLALCASNSLADGVDDSIAEIRKGLKSGQAPKALETLKPLSEIEDPRVKDLLLDLTGDQNDTVAIAAYGFAAKQRHPALLAKLRVRAENQDLAKDRPAVYRALLDAMECYGRLHGLDNLSRGVLEGVIQRYLPLDSESSTRAIRAYSTFRDQETLARLVRWLAQTEAVSGVTGTSSDAFPLSREARLNYEKAHAELLTCLTKLTGGVQFDDAKSWTVWLKKNKNFKFPK